MNRIPPNLSYLTIYNPTLQPSGLIEGDNEDAEEQAHVLFYTSRERAVSRDRMLRQIGLAKALVKFAELFNVDDPCSSVHSQAMRMAMLSPEPNFWIHAGIEVSKIQRADSTNKSDLKGKTTKGKQTAPVYDYEDGFIHNRALHAHILHGYERFKLTHGSFTSILSNLGQQALELQLERFWTVWAWSWDLEHNAAFGEDFGPTLHPSSSSLIPIVDEFAANLSSEIIPVVVCSQYIIPSTRYSEARYPTVLANHLSSMIPSHKKSFSSSETLDTLASSDTIKGKLSSDPNMSKTVSNKEAESGNFLGMPSINVNMDMRKWNWPGYLTFGKGGGNKSTTENPVNRHTVEEIGSAENHDRQLSRVEADSINADALEDAISSDTLSVTSHNGDEEPSAGNADVDDIALGKNSSPISPELQVPDDISSPIPPPGPEFSMTKLYLSSFHHQSMTKQVTLYYLIMTDFDTMLALIKVPDHESEDQENEDADLKSATDSVIKLFEDLETTKSAATTGSSEFFLSASKLLQTQDRYIVSTGKYSYGTPEFNSTSSHLFNARSILDSDNEITEVFSRGQNPQHWHIAKRGLTRLKDDNENATAEESVYLEVFRKETSLTDVDNVLAGVIKKTSTDLAVC